MSKNYCAQQVCLAYAFNFKLLVRRCFLAETYALQWPCEGFTRREFHSLLYVLFVLRESKWLEIEVVKRQPQRPLKHESTYHILGF